MLRNEGVGSPSTMHLARLPAGAYVLLASAPDGTRAVARWVKP